MLRTTIDLDAIAHNTRTLRAHTQAELMCVVKADAYNHGVERCVPVMEANGADAFGVATFAEARRVRELTSKPVLAWLWDVSEAIPEGVDVGVPSIAHMHALIDAPSVPTVYLTVDTGMHRSGIDECSWEEAFALAAQAEKQGTFCVAGLMTHLSCADDPADPYTDLQAAAFRRAIAQARQAGLEVPRNHAANSPATWTRPDLHFDMVRPGVSLYGLEPVDGLDHALRPAMVWSAPVVTVKPLRKGEATGYSRAWEAPDDGFSAVIPAGYADGVQRSWEGALEVTIGGRTYPQVGRVSMDQIVIWLGDNHGGVAPGDEAVLFDNAAALARRAGTIGYEVLCAPRGRTARTYTGEGK